MSRTSVKYLLFITILSSACLGLVSCAAPVAPVITVSKVEDIPDINRLYKDEIKQLRKGMTTHQVNALFPNLERECYESGTCHFTLFLEHRIRFDQRLSDLEVLSGSLISLLALTCALSNDSCNEALAAAVNVGLATALEYDNFTNNSNSVTLVSLVQTINNRTIGVTVNDQGQPVNRYRTTRPPSGILTLLQWVNIEFENGKVTNWAINEPLEQYQPKTYKNELPALEDAL